jgi:predicted  nucleic acid-binding Zn-ribbon protein
MKDKDPNDDELNKDQEDNINEADDSFGLPDLEFNELDEESAEEEPTHSDSEDADETAESSDEVEATESYAEEESEAYNAVEEEAEPPKPSYVPPEPESNAPKIIAFVVIVVIATVAIWYFGFYRPQVAAEKARIEAADNKAKADALAAEKKRAAEQRLAAEEAVNEAADVDEQASQESIFSTISESTGRYYIVIESFVDSDMAADYGKELATKGFSTALLSPQGKRKFHRLTVGDYETFVAAQEEANRLKAEFGEDLWVLKY